MILTNKKHNKNKKELCFFVFTLMLVFFSMSKCAIAQEIAFKNIKNFTEGKINAAKLFGDTLAIAFKKSISLYNAKNLVQLKTISASFEGITNIELLGNKLYLFYSYNVDMNYWDLIKNNIEHNDAIINSIPITENKYGKIIFLNKEKR